ncbi:MAG: hypothetical protein RW306_10270 [Geobacteraceae bacterium]|nr:hypothetical protein [Geobacteraceae bacterium]
MFLLALFCLKPVAWYIAFKSGIIENMNTMLLWAAGITVVLTLVDKVSVADRLPVSAILLTLALYGLMSFTLFSLAWKAKKSKLSVVLNVVGMIGAFAGVNFTMDFLRGFQQIMTR